MRKEAALLILGTTIALAIGAVVLRMVEPRLFGRPKDLEVVQLAREEPSYFDGVFRDQRLSSGEFHLNDPVVVIRGRSFFPEIKGVGPHDLLGFRNRSIPAAAHVVVLGDSQTCGNNTLLDENWPSALQRALGNSVRAYSMSLGGWNPVQYRALFPKALAFQPEVVVVGLYTGNDAAEAARTVYGNPYWKELRPVEHVATDEIGENSDESPWVVNLRNGHSVAFTPARRLISNRHSPAIDAGYEIMRQSMRAIDSAAAGRSVTVLFALIPTKELVFEPLLIKEGIPLRDEYRSLIAAERLRIDSLLGLQSQLSNARVVSLVEPLQSAAASDPAIYPSTPDGHPSAAGYRVIGETVAEVVRPLLRKLADGRYQVVVSSDERWYYQVKAGKVYHFETSAHVTACGLDPKDFTELPIGVISRTGLSGTIESGKCLP